MIESCRAFSPGYGALFAGVIYATRECAREEPIGPHELVPIMTCTRCVGAWSALAVVGLRLAYPDAGRNVANVLAVSGANDWLQAAFKALCS